MENTLFKAKGGKIKIILKKTKKDTTVGLPGYVIELRLVEDVKADSNEVVKQIVIMMVNAIS